MIPNTLRRHYKEHSSNYTDWDQKQHASDYLIFPDNIGPYVSIDELSLVKGELYTFITNKAGRGRKGTIIAIIKGTSSDKIVKVLEKIPLVLRNQVREITMDMANNMSSAARRAFPSAFHVIDRFHVVRLALEALQHVRIKHRWDELDTENKAIDACRKKGKRFKAEKLINGDTHKQLLARCRYIVARKPNEWTESQKLRASLMFDLYPDIKNAYYHVLEFRSIYESYDKATAAKKIADWIDKTKELAIKEFNTVSNTIRNHFNNILNFFVRRSTNANAESFNSKIKLFRANQRGVVDNDFFLFRLMKLFA